MAQCICDHIVLTLLVADDKGVVLKVLHPLCVSIAQLLRRVEVLQGFMVQEEHELLGQEIIATVSQCLHEGVKLLIICGVPESNVISFSLKNSTRWPSWLKTPPIPMPEASHASSNTLLKSDNRRTGAWCWDLRLDKLSNFLIKIMIAAEDVQSKHSTELKHQE